MKFIICFLFCFFSCFAFANNKETYAAECEKGDLSRCVAAGVLYRTAGNKEKALDLFKSACGSANFWALESCFYIGQIYEESGTSEDDRKAITNYKKACNKTTSEPNNNIIKSCNAMGRIYKEKGDIKNAVKFYKKACKKNYYVSIGSCRQVYRTYEGNNETGKALSFYKEICNGDYQFSTLICHDIGKIYREREDTENALVFFKKACEDKGVGYYASRGCYLAGQIYERKDMDSKAKKLYRKSCNEEDDNFNHLHGCERLAKMYEESGNNEDIEKALKVYRNMCKDREHRLSRKGCYQVHAIHTKRGDSLKASRFYESICLGRHPNSQHICDLRQNN